ncbi:HPr kinase/phosphorylase [Terrihabitans sp. B22-R8]|uniref:HPr kinase/phosphorylase n=1 Tax=Terrihabitans sp. B22-R8 TaxID=3425128 RepID=UPI00403D3797
MTQPSIHATCVALDGKGILITGPSGMGKSRFAHILLLRARLYGYKAELISDDRVMLQKHGRHLFASAPSAIAGRMEIRGLGIAYVEHRASAPLEFVVQLCSAKEFSRLPDESSDWIALDGVRIRRVQATSPELAFDLIITLLEHHQFKFDGHESLARGPQDGNTDLS